MTEPTKEQIERAKEIVTFWYNYGCGMERNEFEKIPIAFFDELVRLNAQLLAEREAHRWIPVSERLPQQYCSVIVHAVVRAIDNSRNVEIEGEGFINEDGTWRIHKLAGEFQVTHWQDLPIPLQQEQPK